MTQPVSTSAVVSIALAVIVATLRFVPPGLSAQAPAGPPPSPQRQVLDRYCAACHNEKLKTAGLNLVQGDLSKPGAYPELWEKVVRKVRTGIMPPANMAQPSEAERLTLVTFLETSLDAASAARPNPGRTETLRRLNRTDYQNAIRDLILGSRFDTRFDSGAAVFPCALDSDRVSKRDPGLAGPRYR